MFFFLFFFFWWRKVGQPCFSRCSLFFQVNSSANVLVLFPSTLHDCIMNKSLNDTFAGSLKLKVDADPMLEAWELELELSVLCWQPFMHLSTNIVDTVLINCWISHYGLFLASDKKHNLNFNASHAKKWSISQFITQSWLLSSIESRVVGRQHH